MSNPLHETVPRKLETIGLQKAGLGRKKYTLWQDGVAKVKSKLEIIYPKLVEEGGSVSCVLVEEAVSLS